VTAEDTHHSMSVADVVIDQDGRALVIQRRDNAHWEWPGGILERGETITEAYCARSRKRPGSSSSPLRLTVSKEHEPGNRGGGVVSIMGVP
jgi:8-oxo-dGTP diphosphatase